MCFSDPSVRNFQKINNSAVRILPHIRIACWIALNVATPCIRFCMCVQQNSLDLRLYLSLQLSQWILSTERFLKSYFRPNSYKLPMRVCRFDRHIKQHPAPHDSIIVYQLLSLTKIRGEEREHQGGLQLRPCPDSMCHKYSIAIFCWLNRVSPIPIVISKKQRLHQFTLLLM